MRLDPQAQTLADQLAQWPRPDFASLTAPAYRALLAAFPVPPTPDDTLAGVEDSALPGPGGSLRIRLYRPAAGPGLPLTVFFHGGGFVSCGLDTHDNLCRRLAAQSGAIVASIDYRLAPEHPFPAATDDAVAAVRWLHGHAPLLGADAARMAVAGDSAGATLATVAAQALRGTEVALRHQLLFYPVADSACDTPSHRELADAPVLTHDMMRWFWRHYLPDAPAGLDPRASPLRQADLRGMPPATVLTAGCDPLRDEGEAYARALVAAGVSVTQRRWPGQFHGFASLLGTLDAAAEALALGADQLKQAFAA